MEMYLISFKEYFISPVGGKSLFLGRLVPLEVKKLINLEDIDSKKSI